MRQWDLPRRRYGFPSRSLMEGAAQSVEFGSSLSQRSTMTCKAFFACRWVLEVFITMLKFGLDRMSLFPILTEFQSPLARRIFISVFYFN